MVECRQVNPYFGTKCPLGWEWFWVSRVLICCKKAKLDMTKRTWRVGITRSAARAGTPNRMNLLYPAPITVTYSQTEMDLESRWCMVSKQKGFLFLCARGFWCHATHVLHSSNKYFPKAILFDYNWPVRKRSHPPSYFFCNLLSTFFNTMSGFFATNLPLVRKYSILAEVCLGVKRACMLIPENWIFI